MPLSQESRILELKYASKRFGVMLPEERILSAYKMLLVIHTVSGWTIPASELMDILVEQFEKKLAESYATLNADEIEYAFRIKSSDTKDWGKALNLSMIDEVLLPYLQDRMDISQIEESNSHKPLLTMDEAARVMTDEEWALWLKDIRNYDFKLFPSTAYDFLEKKGEIILTKEQKHEYMHRAIAHLSGSFDPISREGIEFTAMKKEGVYSAKITGTLKTFAKRFALQDYFNTHPNE